MEDINKTMEQPQDELLSQGADAQEDVGLDKDSGSILGKFKDQENLQKAYENLQKEFTKKCQILAETQRKLGDISNAANYRQDFIDQNPKATKYIDILDQLVASDKQKIGNMSYLSAWNKFRQDNFVSKEELSSDQDFLENYILNNQDIKQRVIDEYFENLNINKVPPMIAKQIGSKSVLTKPNKPKSFAEAGELIKDLIEK